jgi:hypothetical protein
MTYRVVVEIEFTTITPRARTQGYIYDTLGVYAMIFVARVFVWPETVYYYDSRYLY